MSANQKRFRVRIDRERCKGCEICVAACPHQVLDMAPSMNSRGAHFARVHAQDACTGCLRCVLMCPDTAIEVELEQDHA